MEFMNYYDIAVALYYDGWRSYDFNLLLEAYEFNAEEVACICKLLKAMEGEFIKSAISGKDSQ